MCYKRSVSCLFTVQLTNANEKKLAFVVLGDGLSSFLVSGIFIGLLGQKHQQVTLDFSAEDLLGGFVIEVNNQRKSISCNEFANGFDVGESFSHVIAAFIELLEQDNGISVNLIFGGNIRSGGGNSEFVVIVVGSDILENDANLESSLNVLEQSFCSILKEDKQSRQ